MKLQSQAGEQCGGCDSDDRQVDSSSRSSAPELHISSSLSCDSKHEKGSPTWSKPSSSAIHSPVSDMHQRPRDQEGSEEPSPEDFRCCSIAKLRAKARDYEAEIHSTVAKASRERQMKTQGSASGPHRDWNRCSHYTLPQNHTEHVRNPIQSIIYYCAQLHEQWGKTMWLRAAKHTFLHSKFVLLLRLSQCHVLSMKPIDPFQISGILRSRRHRSWVNFYRGWTQTTTNNFLCVFPVCSVIQHNL